MSEAEGLPPRIEQWWPILLDVGHRHRVDPLLLAAILDRESRGGEALTPRGPTGTGDGGHGRGLMQIDDRYHQAFVERTSGTGVPLWTIPFWNISYATTILADDLHAFQDDEVRAVGAYNAGRHRVMRAVSQLTRPFDPATLLSAVDSVTTGGNYVSWTFARRQAFLKVLPKQ